MVIQHINHYTLIDQIRSFVVSSDSDMQHTNADNKDAQVQESTTATGTTSLITQSAPKKAPPKVVKNPLFGSSMSSVAKKQKPEPLKVNKRQVKEVTEQPKIEIPRQQQKIEKKQEQVSKDQPVKEIVQEKKQAVKEQENPVEVKIESKKPTVKDLFSSTKKQEQTIEPIVVVPQKKPQAKKIVQPEKKEQYITKSIDNLITQEHTISQNQHQARFKITESFQKGSTLHKSTLYKIEGNDKHGPFQVIRKYTEFQALRKLVRGRWPGFFIPAVTSKSDLKGHSQKQNELKFILQNFLLGLSYSSELYYKQEVQLFLRSPDIDIHQMAQQMPVLKVKDVINRYASSFGDSFFEEKVDINPIKKFTSELRKIANSLTQICTKLLLLCESYDAYASGMSKYVQFAKGYEKSCLLEYTCNSREKTIISKDESHNIDKLRDFSKNNPFYQFYALLNCQARDALSFVEILVATDIFELRRDDVQSQLKQLQKEVQEISLGHKTIKTVTSRKPKEEIKTELEDRIKKLSEQKEHLAEIQRMAEIILVKLQIQAYKKFRRETFREAVRQYAHQFGAVIPELQTVWRLLLEQSRTLLK